MKYITKKARVRDILSAWDTQYPPGKHTYGEYVDKLRAAIAALDPRASKKEIDEIIGNTTWTTGILCMSCGKRVEEAVSFDDDETRICFPCLKKALALKKDANKIRVK